VLAEQFDDLVARAQRDPAFAFELARALNKCSHADEDLANVSRVAAHIKTDPEQRMALIEKRYAACKGLSTKDMELQYELMAAAARAGNLEAQLSYVDVVNEAIRTGYALREPNAMDVIRTNYEQFTLAAARTSSSEALYRAFQMYDNGKVISRDPVQAYNYLKAYGRTLSAAQEQMVRDRLAAMEAGMTPEQLRRIRGN
jgi:TPR repeat protein